MGSFSSSHLLGQQVSTACAANTVPCSRDVSKLQVSCVHHHLKLTTGGRHLPKVGPVAGGEWSTVAHCNLASTCRGFENDRAAHMLSVACSSSYDVTWLQPTSTSWSSCRWHMEHRCTSRSYKHQQGWIWGSTCTVSRLQQQAEVGLVSGGKWDTVAHSKLVYFCSDW